MKAIQSLIIVVLLGVVIYLVTKTDAPKEDVMLAKFVDWHLGFTTNVDQRDADETAKVSPRWGLSELRFQQIWAEREDGYWIYYETSQPDVRPDRNQIWRLYRNDQGNLKIDAYNFNDIAHGITFWGKGSTPAAFDSVSLGDLTTTPGCNGTYHWQPEFEHFSGVNAHGECYTIGRSTLIQHVEISKAEDGTLLRNDWHTFYDENGIAKQGSTYKSGTHGATRHKYTERYKLIAQ